MIGSRGGVVGSDGLFWVMRRSCLIDEFENNRPIGGGDESIEVPTSGPLTFTDPKTMLEECFAGRGIARSACAMHHRHRGVRDRTLLGP
jgi:hypothetical protein